MIRQCPPKIPEDVFAVFNQICGINDIGEHPDDWGPWFTMYAAGWNSHARKFGMPTLDGRNEIII